MDASNTSEMSDVLRSAWKRFAELDSTAIRLTSQHHKLRRWIAIFGVIATVVAVVLDRLPDSSLLAGFAGKDLVLDTLQIILIMLPITISVFAAYINKFLGNGEWLTLRAAAEELLKEIYIYRTILQGHPERAHWLSHRMVTIMRRVYKSMSGQLVLENYDGALPPYHNPKNPDSDPGFCDLDGDEYLRFRVINQRNWHRDRISQRQNELKRIQLTILAMGGLGALFAALGNTLTAWVAVTAAIASALAGWEQLRSLDETIMIYSRVTIELTFARDEWESVPRENRTKEQFIRLVRDSEDILWSQNQKYVSTMQDALAAAAGDEARLVEDMIRSGENPLTVAHSRVASAASQVLSEAQEKVGHTIEASFTEIHTEVETVLAEAHDHDHSDVEGFMAEVAEQMEEGAFSEAEADIPSMEEFVETAERIEEAMPGEADAMREMMEATGVTDPPVDFVDEDFPETETAAMMEEIPETLSPATDDMNGDEEDFSDDGEQSMIEEALSGFVDESAEDEEIKG